VLAAHRRAPAAAHPRGRCLTCGSGGATLVGLWLYRLLTCTSKLQLECTRLSSGESSRRIHGQRVAGQCRGKGPLKSDATRREIDGATRCSVCSYLSCDIDGIAACTLCGTTKICSALTRDVHRGIRICRCAIIRWIEAATVCLGGRTPIHTSHVRKIGAIVISTTAAIQYQGAQQSNNSSDQ